jgi:hypothetical protein
MRLTLGDEDALTNETVTETLRRVSSEIKKEESEKLNEEQNAHKKTQSDLALARAEKFRVQARLYWRCNQKANFYSWAVAVCVAVLLLGGIGAGLGLKSSVPVLGWILVVGSSLVTFATVLDIMIGFSVTEMREKLEKRLFTWFIKREAAATGVDLRDFQ